MYATSAAYKSQIRRSHTAIVRAEVWSGDRKVLDLEPLDGSVDIESRRAIRRTLRLSVAAPDPTLVLARNAYLYSEFAADYANYTATSVIDTYGAMPQLEDATLTEVDAGIVPDDSFDPLAPFGNEIRVWRGIEVTEASPLTYTALAGLHADYADLEADWATYGTLATYTEVTTEQVLVPLGVFFITNVDIKQSDTGTTVDVTGSDRSIRISRSKWTKPYKTEQGGNVATVIAALLRDRWDEIETDFVATSTTVNSAVFGTETDNDPWRDAQKIAEAAGMELFFDGNGVAILQEVRDYATATADQIYRENAEAMVLGVSRSLSNERTFNGAIVVTEGTYVVNVYRGEAWDDDSSSPTYRYGNFGQVPQFFSSPLIASQADADAAALALLNKSKGASENVNWTQIVDPSLDAGDVIAVTNSATKVDRLMVLDRVSIPLSPSSTMSSTARTVRNLNGYLLEIEEA